MNDGRLTIRSCSRPSIRFGEDAVQMSPMRDRDPTAYFNLYPGRFISAHATASSEGPHRCRGPQMPVKPDPNAAAGWWARRGCGPPAVAIGDDSELAGSVRGRKDRRTEKLLHRAGTGERRVGRQRSRERPISRRRIPCRPDLGSGLFASAGAFRHLLRTPDSRELQARQIDARRAVAALNSSCTLHDAGHGAQRTPTSAIYPGIRTP